MKTSEKGVRLIQRFEGLKLRPYLCPGGYWTIGYGHAIRRSESFGAQITTAQAVGLLHKDLKEAEDAVARLVEVELTQGQFDALVSFAYNVGPDIDADDIPEGLGDSTLLRLLNQGDTTEACAEFAKWHNAGGVPLAGLLNRRIAEMMRFLETD